MKTRTPGKSGIRVAVVGLDCEALIGKEDSCCSEAPDLMKEAWANAIDLYFLNP